LETEEARSEILKIPGVGPKSADCLLSIGQGKPSIAVDVNVFRATTWIFAFPWAENPNYNDNNQIRVVKELFDSSIPKDAFLTQIIHTFFLLYGKYAGSRHNS
jgi:endonuclease III